MNLKEMSDQELKAMVYDEAQKLAIAQNNIRLLEEEIKSRETEEK